MYWQCLQNFKRLYDYTIMYCTSAVSKQVYCTWTGTQNMGFNNMGSQTSTDTCWNWMLSIHEAGHLHEAKIPVTSYKHFSCSTSICLWNFGLTIPIYIHCTCTYKVLNLPRSFRSEILFLARSRCSSPIQSLKQLTSCKPREHIAFYLISVLL